MGTAYHRHFRKGLAGIDPADAIAIMEKLERLFAGDREGLDIRKMQGHSNRFRLRYGVWRVIYEQHRDHFHVLTVQPRKDAY